VPQQWENYSAATDDDEDLMKFIFIVAFGGVQARLFTTDLYKRYILFSFKEAKMLSDALRCIALSTVTCLLSSEYGQL
jgi:hypothetical protein